LRDELTTQFEGLGKLKYFLEIETSNSKQGIFIFQIIYELDLLKETRNLVCKAARA